MSVHDTIDIEVQVKAGTEKAILVSDGETEVWLPLSKIEVEYKPGGKAIVTLPEWLAIEKELV